VIKEQLSFLLISHFAMSNNQLIHRSAV